jgi:glycosyltransferase involved in cell wall biosynthesis
MPNLKVSGCYALTTLLSSQLRQAYAHTVICEDDLCAVPDELLWHIQGAGAELLNVDVIERFDIADTEADAAIMYNVTGHPGIGTVVPTVYYSYGVRDDTVGADTVVACSEYASRRLRDGTLVSAPDAVIPPMIQARSFRRLESPNHNFRVGIITSGAYDKYPCKSVIRLLSDIPDDIEVLVSTLPKYPHLGVELAIQSRIERNAAIACPVRPAIGVRYLLACDVVVCCSDEKHSEPYGRTAVEAMALRKAVLCENRGNYPHIIDHGVNALLYNDLDQALNYIEQLRSDDTMRTKLGTNAQMWAAWQDVSVHIGDFRRILKAIGV